MSGYWRKKKKRFLIYFSVLVCVAATGIVQHDSLSAAGQQIKRTVKAMPLSIWMNFPFSPGFGNTNRPGSGFPTLQKAQYRKVGGIVYLRGNITKTDISEADPYPKKSDVIGVLPAGYRPPDDVTFVQAASGSKFGLIKIRKDGRVEMWNSPRWPSISLDGIFFFTE